MENNNITWYEFVDRIDKVLEKYCKTGDIKLNTIRINDVEKIGDMMLIISDTGLSITD